MNQEQSSIGLSFTPPATLIDAMSEIQQYYLVEQSGQPLHKDFFTMNHVMGFSRVGLHSAFRDSIVWLSLYVLVGTIVYYVQENYLAERTTQILLWTVKGSPLCWFIKIASFGGLFFSTSVCVLISRYYTGMTPKRAINTLFLTRAMFLISFSFVSFLITGVIFKFALSDTAIKNVYFYLAKIDSRFARSIYHFLHDYVKRALFEAGITVLIASTAAIVMPFCSMLFFRVHKKKNRDLGIEGEGV
jgi:hypothetical protein